MPCSSSGVFLDAIIQGAGSVGMPATGRDQIPLFDVRRIYPHGSRMEILRAEEEFYTDVFFQHRWYHANRNRDGKALVQAWNAFIHNVECIGRRSWLNKLNAARIRFEQRNPDGNRYRLHQLSKEVGVPCLSWGNPCPACLDNVSRAPRESYLLNNP